MVLYVSVCLSVDNILTGDICFLSGSAELDDSIDLFNESSAFGISDVIEDQHIKQTLNFEETDEHPKTKRPKFISSREQLTQSKQGMLTLFCLLPCILP